MPSGKRRHGKRCHEKDERGRCPKAGRVEESSGLEGERLSREGGQQECEGEQQYRTVYVPFDIPQPISDPEGIMLDHAVKSPVRDFVISCNGFKFLVSKHVLVQYDWFKATGNFEVTGLRCGCVGPRTLIFDRKAIGVK